MVKPSLTDHLPSLWVRFLLFDRGGTQTSRDNGTCVRQLISIACARAVSGANGNSGIDADYLMAFGAAEIQPVGKHPGHTTANWLAACARLTALDIYIELADHVTAQRGYVQCTSRPAMNPPGRRP